MACLKKLPKKLREKCEKAYDLADSFLESIDANVIDAVYLIGSRATGKAHAHSDWDFLVVGDGFNEVEEERVRQDWRVKHKPDDVDIIFSSRPPKKGFRRVA